MKDINTKFNWFHANMGAYIDNYFLLVAYAPADLMFDWLNCFIGSAVLDLTNSVWFLIHIALKSLFMHIFNWILVLEWF